jgi:hypothetical protein
VFQYLFLGKCGKYYAITNITDFAQNFPQSSKPAPSFRLFERHVKIPPHKKKSILIIKIKFKYFETKISFEFVGKVIGFGYKN